MDGLPDEPRPGVPRTITDAQVEEVVVRTLDWRFPTARRTGPTRGAGPAGRASPRRSVHRGSGGCSGSQPWRTEDFKISPDPLLTGKIRDVIGLYLGPAAGAAVFAVDEKPQSRPCSRLRQCCHAPGRARAAQP